MTALSVPQLAGACFQQALEIFRDVWRPIVDARMRAHFGVDYIPHLQALHSSDRVFIDFDAQMIPQFDVNAIAYLLLEDGGLRPRTQPRRPAIDTGTTATTQPIHTGKTAHYVPQLFGFKSDFRRTTPAGTVLLLPNPQFLYEMRRVRNEWAHQHAVPIHQLSQVVHNLVTYVEAVADVPAYSTARRELAIQAALLRFYALQEERDKALQDSAHQVSAMQQSRIQQLHTQLETMHATALPQMIARIDSLQRDQNLLLTGIMESLTDVQQLSAADVTQLRAEIVALREVTRAYRPLQQQLHDAMHLVAAQHATITDLEQQIDRMRALFTASAIKTSPLQHGASAITAKSPTYHVGELSEPIPVIEPYTRWRIVLFVVIALICGLALWLQASLASWIAPMFP